MTTDPMSARQYGSWQFSLTSLMFVTTMVAICAALVSISIGLAVMLIPLIFAGLVRTIRVAAQYEATGVAKPGLFVTFCNSVALVVAAVAVGLATMAVAAMAGILATVMLTIHVLRAARPIYQPFARRLWQLRVKSRNAVVAIVVRIQPVATLRWLEVQSVAGTLSLLAMCRRLFKQCWYGTTAQTAATEVQAS